MILRVLPVLFVAGCGTIHMPAPFAFSSACPEGDVKCQRNLDAQTLKYIGETEAALRLMCTDEEIREAVGDKCLTSTEHGAFAASY